LRRVAGILQQQTAPSQLPKYGVASFPGWLRQGAIMKSAANRRSIMLGGRKSSVLLEDAFWTGLKEIADLRRVTLSKLITEIDATRKQSNLSSAIRIFVLEHFQNKRKQVDLPQLDRAIGNEPERGFENRG
jgi:predicted DNA-binding ribbon-helix-helix protein